MYIYRSLIIIFEYITQPSVSYDERLPNCLVNVTPLYL